MLLLFTNGIFFDYCTRYCIHPWVGTMRLMDCWYPHIKNNVQIAVPSTLASLPSTLGVLLYITQQGSLSWSSYHLMIVIRTSASNSVVGFPSQNKYCGTRVGAWGEKMASDSYNGAGRGRIFFGRKLSDSFA